MTKRMRAESREKRKTLVARRDTRTDSSSPFHGELRPILQLQQTLGNHQVAQLIQEKQLTPAGRIRSLQRKPTLNAAHDGQSIVLQRDSKKDDTTRPQDFAVLLSPDKDFVTLANAIAPDAKILHASSVDDLAKQLKAIHEPIGTLYFVAHMDPDGDLLFTRPGVDDFVPAEKIASQIKGSVHVENIDFRGCNVAQAPEAMNTIRVALSATKVTGSNCSLVKQISDPIKIFGKAVTQPKDLNAKNRTAFDAGLKQARELFTDNKKKCIINDSVDGYFQTGGRLIAYWANPESMADDAGWDDKKSICYKDLKVEKVDVSGKPPVLGPNDCKLLELGKK